MSETERMLAELYAHCPVCFAMVHRENKVPHWDFHLRSISGMAHGMYIVTIDDAMKKQGVTWPGDLNAPETA